MSREAQLVQIGAAAAKGSPAPLRGRLDAYSLRVSLLEQCQLRCGYCLPGAVQPYTTSAARLRPADYAVLARAFAEVGVDKVRFTGGEPLLREDIVDVVIAFKAGLPAAQLALTTNGLRLPLYAEALAQAGLSRVTVHLDTLRVDRYPVLMGRGDPADVLAQAERAVALFAEVKLNVVVQRGLNDDELLDFLALSRRTGIEVRFIELMDTGSAHAHVEQ
ncbi:MAG: radical SAM protein, partial [Myxococcota bacterium]